MGAVVAGGEVAASVEEVVVVEGRADYAASATTTATARRVHARKWGVEFTFVTSRGDCVCGILLGLGLRSGHVFNFLICPSDIDLALNFSLRCGRRCHVRDVAEACKAFGCWCALRDGLLGQAGESFGFVLLGEASPEVAASDRCSEEGD